jgi:hypothetical protein
MTEQKFPTAGPEDSDEVTLALTTANSLWQSGETDEALRWLKKAMENAEEAGDTMRSVELARAAADLKTAVEKGDHAGDQADAPTTDPSNEADTKESFQPKEAAPTPLDDPSRPKLSKPPKPPPAPKTRLESPIAKAQNGKSRATLGGSNGYSLSAAAAVSDAASNDGPVLTQALRVGIKRSVRDGELLVARLAEDGDVPAGYHEALVVLVDPSKDVLDKLS